jgi:alpha-tubulin suppressor-like RCC1 family protein
LNTCGVAEDSFAYCWGESWFGETGTGNASPGRYVVTSPTRVTTLERFVQIALGLRHGCGLTADGRVFCWGFNDNGELGATTSVICGDPSIPNAALGSCSPIPIAVNTQLRFTAITAGGFHTCGLVANGDVYCWGDNAEGQLGAGYVSPKAGVVKVISLR